jgi:hypothetical protein
MTPRRAGIPLTEGRRPLDYAGPGRPQPLWRRHAFRTTVRAYVVASYAVMIVWSIVVTVRVRDFTFHDWDAILLLIAPVATPLLLLARLLSFATMELPDRVGTVLLVVAYVAAFGCVRPWLDRRSALDQR